MSKVVEYILSLKDQFSPALEAAKEKTEGFQETVAEAKEKTEGMFSALGAGFALFEGFEFLKKSREDFEQLEQAQSQIEAGLESTRGAAGLTFEELSKGAEESAHNLNFTKGQIEQMQSVLLTFPAVTKKTFGDASQAIFDMATRLHQDLDNTAIQVGKALQDPIKGITALRRVGVNFNEQQTEMIQKMVQAGQTARAQAFILRELQTEFGGSAEAAARANVGFRFNKSWEELRETVGELTNSFLRHLAPSLEWLAEKFKDATEWAKEHRKVMGAVIDILLPVAGVIAGIIAVTQIWAAVQWLLNAAMLANPLILIVVGIVALVSAVVYCYNHFKTFRAIILGVWEVLKAYVNFMVTGPIKIFRELGEAIINIFHPAKMIEHLKAAASVVFDGAKEIGSAFKKGYDEGMSSGSDATDPNEKAAKAPKPGKPVPVAPTEASTSPGNKVSGQRINTFNISISGGLVHEMTFHTTNLTESTARIRDAVARALTSSVNDSQIIGDH